MVHFHEFSWKSLKCAEMAPFYLKYHYAYNVLREGVKKSEKVPILWFLAHFSILHFFSILALFAYFCEKSENMQKWHFGVWAKISLKWARETNGFVEIIISCEILWKLCKKILFSCFLKSFCKNIFSLECKNLTELSQNLTRICDFHETLCFPCSF